MPPIVYSVGVDLGGTWIRLQAVDAMGHPLQSFKSEAPARKQLVGLISRQLRIWKAHPRELFVASRGVWAPDQRKAMARDLRSLATRVSVLSDVEGAWHTAFTQGQAGVVVISGTGSIAYGRAASERYARAGGLGPQKGDEGSGFWLGQQWILRAAMTPLAAKRLKRLTPVDVRYIAALARQVGQRARRGNLIAKAIVQEAQLHLAHLVRSVAIDLKLQEPVQVSWAGSLLADPSFRSGFFRALRRLGRYTAVRPRQETALAVARLFQHG